jgi:hypothetical protein
VVRRRPSRDRHLARVGRERQLRQHVPITQPAVGDHRRHAAFPPIRRTATAPPRPPPTGRASTPPDQQIHAPQHSPQISRCRPSNSFGRPAPIGRPILGRPSQNHRLVQYMGRPLDAKGRLSWTRPSIAFKLSRAILSTAGSLTQSATARKPWPRSTCESPSFCHRGVAGSAVTSRLAQPWSRPEPCPGLIQQGWTF